MLDCRHLLQMTGQDGILQFSHLDKPDLKSGFTLDDNARALIAALHLDGFEQYAHIYTGYLAKSQRPDGSWSNILLDGRYYSSYDSEDSLGRAILACSLAANGPWPGIADICCNLLTEQLPRVASFRSPRAVAYVLIALCHGKIPIPTDNLTNLKTNLLEKLASCYQNCHASNWHWFENYLTYCNGVIPQAMFALYMATGDKKALKIGYESLNFLNDLLYKKGYLNVIGNHGWLSRGKKAAVYDQQPVDAASMAFANLEAYRAIGEAEYLELALLAYQWYKGRNINHIPLIDPASGGCYDALTPAGVNLNQGAEAVLSLLLTEILMKSFISENSDIELTC